MEWVQLYDPLGNAWLSTIAAALPIFFLLATLAILEWKAQWAALAGLVTALFVSIVVYGMPAQTALATAVYGAAYGLFPIGWIILNAVFLYSLTVETGQFEIVKRSVAGLSADRRVQALLIAFSFGAFIEGAAGFGTPVAITAALLMGLGFTPLYAAGLSLIANTAPVAYGAIGTPILTLAVVTGIDAQLLSAMAGRQLPIVSVIVPAWLVVTMSGWRGLRGAWPAVAVCGGSFAIVQFLVEQLRRSGAGGHHGRPRVARQPGVVLHVVEARGDLGVSVCGRDAARADTAAIRRDSAAGARARVDAVGLPFGLRHRVGDRTDQGVPERRFRGFAAYRKTGTQPPPHAVLSHAFEVPALHRMIFREFPVEVDRVDRARIQDPAYRAKRAEAARFVFNWLSATGTAILFAALATALYLRIPRRVVFTTALATLKRMRWPLVTIAFMLSLGFVTRYGGTDATLGLAFTRTGWFYPFFAALLGWLGVALTGSDTSSNVLFGSLQKITAQQLGLDPVLITTANSTGGVMGKMVDAQSIVVSTAATNQHGQEGKILRFVFWHSIALAVIMGIIVMLQAYVFPWMVPK